MQTQIRTLLLYHSSTLCTFYDKTIYITAVFMLLSKDFYVKLHARPQTQYGISKPLIL